MQGSKQNAGCLEEPDEVRYVLDYMRGNQPGDRPVLRGVESLIECPNPPDDVDRLDAPDIHMRGAGVSATRSSRLAWSTIVTVQPSAFRNRIVARTRLDERVCRP